MTITMITTKATTMARSALLTTARDTAALFTNSARSTALGPSLATSLARSTSRSALYSTRSGKPQLQQQQQQQRQQQQQQYARRRNAADAAITASSYVVVPIGAAMLGVIGYYLLTDLFGDEGTTHIYADTLRLVQANSEVAAIVGLPLDASGDDLWTSRPERADAAFSGLGIDFSKLVKEHGGSTGWRNRRNPAVQSFVDQYGNRHILVRYNILGDRGHGIVHADLVQLAEGGAWQYRFLIADIAPNDPDAPYHVIDEGNSQQQQQQQKSGWLPAVKAKMSFKRVTKYKRVAIDTGRSRLYRSFTADPDAAAEAAWYEGWC
ncbi:hypothetical protein GQ42DRAFT_177513 [Ramicandelaber brevisporus]|nr:hypothetical protein GQ42DRAFT_177513 [Ramicandelaber brevisporus]